jgi:hypothetical protein
MITLSNEHLPWLIIVIMALLLLMPKANGGKTDFFSRLIGLLGIKVKKNFEDIEKDTGLVGEDGFDADLYAFRISRLNEKLNASKAGDDISEQVTVKNAKSK